MATEVGTAYVQIIPSARGIKGSISSAIKGEASSAGTSAGSLLAGGMKKAIAAAGIGTALTMGLKSVLSEGANLEQTYLGGLDTIYGDAADKAREYATAAQKAGVSQSQYAEQAISFGAALRQAYGGDTSKAVEAANTAIMDMTDNAAKMGTPLQSIQDAYQGFAKQNYTMLDNLKLGYGGTKTEMERLLSDAEKISGVHYDISNLGDVYDAIHVIQGDLGLTGVAAEEAASTFSGSFGAMRAAAQNLMGDLMLGENVAPAMKTLADSAATFLFDNLIPALGRIFQSLPVAMSTFIQSGLPQFLAAGKQMVQALYTGAQTQLPTMISSMMNALVGLSGKIRAGLGSFVDLGLKLIQSIATGIISNIPTFIETVPTIIENFAGVVNDNAPKILNTGVSIIKALAMGIVKAVPLLVANMPKIIKAIVALVKAFNWVNLGKVVVKGISKGLSAAGGAMKSAVNKGVKGVKDAVSSGFTAAKTKALHLIEGLKTGVKTKIDAAKEAVKSAVEKIKGFFPLSIGRIFSGLKLPHFSVSGGQAPFGIGGKGSMPHFSVSWYKKAMETPYLFTGPTLFGAGEAGDEMLYGRKALMNDISEAISGDNHGGATITNYFTVNGADSPEEFARQVARTMKLEMRTI